MPWPGRLQIPWLGGVRLIPLHWCRQNASSPGRSWDHSSLWPDLTELMASLANPQNDLNRCWLATFLMNQHFKLGMHIAQEFANPFSHQSRRLHPSLCGRLSRTRPKWLQCGLRRDCGFGPCDCHQSRLSRSKLKQTSRCGQPCPAACHTELCVRAQRTQLCRSRCETSHLKKMSQLQPLMKLKRNALVENPKPKILVYARPQSTRMRQRAQMICIPKQCYKVTALSLSWSWAEPCAMFWKVAQIWQQQRWFGEINLDVFLIRWSQWQLLNWIIAAGIANDSWFGLFWILADSDFGCQEACRACPESPAAQVLPVWSAVFAWSSKQTWKKEEVSGRSI